ncbi:ATP-dependent Clp protease ATP-binding subunit [Patescibacteria group bacterium]|nr:ATP-dependent Clp protease ATP-binding subunit [Patescibacteria group bacterium]MBU1673753.1 ATP-dependent Clp protease ATP-binding subunit [Patescibacteria group bacterium]MBU1964093.1 ATP-dependent Clp protease ATP-binding subunit [Patescibacteria group bacterium]
MEEPKKDIRMEFYPCTKCSGFGFSINQQGKHVPCAQCQGEDSLYGYMDKQVIYLAKKISPKTAKQEKARKTFKSFYNIFLVILGVAGILLLGWQVMEVLSAGRSPFSVFGMVSWKMALFWLSLLIDMYIYFRIQYEVESRKFITQRKKGDKGPHVGKIPSWEKFHALPKKEKIDILDFLHPDSMQALEGSLKIAETLNQKEVGTLHILGGDINTPQVFMFFQRLNLDIKKVQQTLARMLQSLQPGLFKELAMNEGALKAILLSYEQSYLDDRRQITPIEIFKAVLSLNQETRDMFYDMEVDDEKLKNVTKWLNLREDMAMQYKDWSRAAGSKPKSFMNRAMTARPTPALDSIGQDYTQMARARAFFPLIGREQEVDQAFRILKEEKGSPMLVGPAGVGKSTILQGVAELMTAEDVPKKLQDKRLVVIDPGGLIAGAEGIGTLEARLTKIIGEVVMAGNVVLAIEDIHKLLGTGSTGAAADLGGILMNYISQGYINVIGTTTTQEYQQYIQNVETFLRRFQVVKVDELDIDSAIQVCEAKAFSYEAKYKMFVTYDAIDTAVKLSDRYIQDRHLPAKALDILEEAVILASETKKEGAQVTKDDVGKVLSEKTNVEVSAVTEDEAAKLLNLESEMHKRVIGQDEAINAIADALRRAREELRDVNRPIASFLFLGPTGVGKTETAKTIAEVYFGNENNMIRVDMSEYMERDAVNKLIGQPGQPGILTEKVRQMPFAIVLLDEFEKAHPDVLNLFLQVMEDGRLTDGQGRTVDFTSTMIIATSNAGTQTIQEKLQAGEPLDRVKMELMEGGLSQMFRPELLNRFDNVVLFTPLTKGELFEIGRLIMNRIAERMITKGITIQATDEAIQELALKGYDPKFGARPLRRVMQDTVDAALAKLLLGKKIGRRDVVILDKGGQMNIRQAERF